MLGYSFSYDEERFGDNLNSRKDAMEEGFAQIPDAECVYTGQNIELKPEEIIDADTIIDAIINHEDYMIDCADGYLADVTEEQGKELTESLQRVVGNWLDKNKLRPSFWKIEDVEMHVRERR